MIPTRFFLKALIFSSPLLAAPLLHADPAQAQARLKGAVEEVLAVADRAPSKAALPNLVRPVLNKHISFSTMTRRAVGPGWSSFNAAQQAQAVQLFSTLIVRTYVGKFTPGEHPAITYKTAVSPAAGRVDVPTSMVYKGSRYSVTYRMEQAEGWRITDVVIEGVSMIANYRTQLDSQFKKGGAQAVINSLNQSVSRPQ
ncbi:MAG: ABC transporter substrate-binding protein [Verrucomicrobiaceae bacterium]|nr:ABC transporter substrate-binding protein [Verrucomicrobiaceae bacterium]